MRQTSARSSSGFMKWLPDPCRSSQSSLMPASATTRDQGASSNFNSRSMRSGRPPAGNRPCLTSASRTCGSRNMAFNSALILSMVPGGVFAGANTVPGLDLEIGPTELAQRLDIRENRRARGAHHRKHAQLAGEHTHLETRRQSGPEGAREKVGARPRRVRQRYEYCGPARAAVRPQCQRRSSRRPSATALARGRTAMHATRSSAEHPARPEVRRFQPALVSMRP